jgi:D-sedoheptulose 7-phosphate isomerase
MISNGDKKNAKWPLFISNIGSLLSTISFRVKTGKDLSIEEGFAHWRTMTIAVRQTQKTLFLIGNGASASMASHFAADLEKNAHLHTQVFSDLSLITAVSNDLGYENVFCEPLKHCACKGDMLLAISSSGCSKNIIKAFSTARRRGVSLISLTAMSPDNPIRKLADLNIYITAGTYGLAETCHAAILHYWMDLLDLRKRR